MAVDNYLEISSCLVVGTRPGICSDLRRWRAPVVGTARCIRASMPLASYPLMVGTRLCIIENPLKPSTWIYIWRCTYHQGLVSEESWCLGQVGRYSVVYPSNNVEKQYVTKMTELYLPAR